MTRTERELRVAVAKAIEPGLRSLVAEAKAARMVPSVESAAAKTLIAYVEALLDDEAGLQALSRAIARVARAS